MEAVKRSSKRISISEQVFSRIYNDVGSLREFDRYKTKSEIVAKALENCYNKSVELNTDKYIELDDETLKKIDFLIKLNIENNIDEVVKKAVQMYLDAKKDDMKKIVDSL